MNVKNASSSDLRKPLRLWPGLVIAAVLLLAGFVLPRIVPAVAGNELLIGAGGGLAIFLWWTLFSRARWFERLGVPALMVVALLATSQVVHESIAGGGMGMLLYLLAIPVLGLALVAWAWAGRPLSGGPRLGALVVSVVLACSVLAAIRTEGVRGGGFDLHWRWTSTPEERLLAETRQEPPEGFTPDGAEGQPNPRLESAASEPVDSGSDDLASAEPAAAASSDAPIDPPAAEAPALSLPDIAPIQWPGFRGPHRDGVVEAVRIDADWTASPPVELWRRPVGPGWSSFAVQGNRLYTQEQRGEEEIVACYDALTGEPVWMHRDAVRFWESNGGPGPRATPTLNRGRVYALGATGILNALNAADGAVLWSRDAASDAGVQVPYWGMAASPLAVDDLLIVAASGRLIAYDLATGEPRWLGPAGGVSYSSPHLTRIDGIAQIVLLRTGGAISVAAADGELLWEHAWEGGAIVQPAVTAEGDILISVNGMAGGLGVRRLAVERSAGGWIVSERWTSRGLKPYFNDFVLHDGHAFGFDGRILSSIDLGNGERTWKDGRFGHGQLVLLPAQGLLLVLSEDGELALVQASPDRFLELARIPALDGKTWNHPVVADDLLLLRNGQEMAAFRLPIERR